MFVALMCDAILLCSVLWHIMLLYAIISECLVISKYLKKQYIVGI